MRCRSCTSKAVTSRPALCLRHCSQAFERRVRATIRTHELLAKKDRVCVACSGGKDSTVLLFLLKKLGYRVTALAIDEGIAGYRDGSLLFLKRFCKNEEIPLTIVGFEETYGSSLDTILEDKTLHPCTVCGTFRRQLLNKHAQQFDAIATGHNADDEAQAVLMNLCRANLDLYARGGPVTTSEGKGFVKKVKPLYFCTEKEIMRYAVLHGLAPSFEECPYAKQAYRADVRDALNAYEAAHPGAKVRILKHHLKTKAKLPPQRTTTKPCDRCGEPSQQGLCKACRLAEQVRDRRNVGRFNPVAQRL